MVKEKIEEETEIEPEKSGKTFGDPIVEIADF